MEDNTFLTPKELAERWDYSIHTLASWRRKGMGPTHIKRGYRGVLYPYKAIVQFEAENPGFNLG